MANKITIEFQAKGANKLKNQIKALSNEQGKLNGVNNKLNKSSKAVGKGMTDITNKGRLLQNSFATIRSKLLLVSFGFGLLAGSIGKSIRMFGEQERVALKLNNALGFNTIRLRELASELQNVTGVGDETIIGAQGIIASFVRSEEAVAELTTATMDLSSALGMDLNSTANLIGKTIGSTTNSLSRYGISVVGAANSTERIESLLKNVNILFGDTAKVAGKGASGSLNRLSSAFGDLLEQVGNLLANVGIVHMIEMISIGFKQLNSAVEFAANIMPFYNDTLKESAKLSEADAKALNKRMQGIKSINDLTAAEDKLADLNARRVEIQAMLGQVEGKRVEIQQKSVNVNKDVADSQMNLNLALDENFGVQEKGNVITEINIGNQQEYTMALKNSIPIFQEYGHFLKDGNLELEKTTESNKVNIDVNKMQAESLTELIMLNQLIAVTEAKKQELIASGIDQQLALFEAETNLAVARGGMVDMQAKMLILDEKRASINEKFENQLINETQKKAMLLKLDKEKIGLVKKEVESAMKLGASYDDAGKAASAAAREAINAKVREILANQLATVFASVPFPANMVLAAASAGAVSSILEKGFSAMAAIKLSDFEQGGYVGGNRHAQGGTIIEAERGEFVMSRNAVESIGVDNLESMNAGGGASSIVINNPIISSEFVETELPELIAEAVRKGADFGMS